MYVYMLVDIIPFELPLAVFDSVKECAEWLGVPCTNVRKAYERGSVLCGFARCLKVRI